MSTSASHKAFWVRRFSQNRNYYLQPFDPFEDWDRKGSPEIEASDIRLITALYMLYGEAPFILVDRFLSAAIAVVDRAIAEDKCRKGRRAGGFPKNRGECLRARAYATALETGVLPISDLTQASLDYEEWCRGYSSGEWDSQAQANYLSGVRLALIANDLERAAALLKGKSRFKWHATEYAIWVGLANQCMEQPTDLPISDTGLRENLEKFFATVRDPEYKPGVYLQTEIVRFEVGAIYYKYFVSNGSIDWCRVIHLISA